MGTVKLKDKTKVSTLNANSYVPAIDENGKTVLIDKTSLAEVIRAEMGIATKDRNGLMSSGLFNMLSGLVLPTAYLSGNVDSLYEQMTPGLSCFQILSGASGLPYSFGILMHMQRGAASVVTSSQVIGQLFCAGNKKIYIRSGVGDGTSIIYTEWTALI